MDRFKEHFKMNEEDVREYVVKGINFFKLEDDIQVSEIGDGNINYVFKAEDKKTGRSLVIKQADKLLRSSQRPLDIDRNRIEAEVLIYYGKVAGDFAPEIYNYDPIMCALAMEDISDCVNLRHGLMEGKTYKNFSDHISSFMVKTLLPNMDICRDPWEKKQDVKRYTNIELCDISEKLVFTDPYTNFYGTNIVTEENLDFVKREIYEDEKLLLEAGKLKYTFMNNPQTLIHGDLHSGSIFVSEGKTKVIDPEFAFYGPIGYDLGNLVGNLFFSYIYWELLGEDSNEKKLFIGWLKDTIRDIVDKFIDKYNSLYDQLVIDPIAKNKLYKEWLLDSILADACGMAASEVIRRTIGDSKVIEIEGVRDLEKRILMERFLILLGKDLMKNRWHVKDGRGYQIGRASCRERV